MNVCKRKIVKREESSLTDVLRSRSLIVLKKDLQEESYSFYSNQCFIIKTFIRGLFFSMSSLNESASRITPKS